MRIHTSLTNARESFVHTLFMGHPALTFKEVNAVLASDENKALWGVKGGIPTALMMASKRLQELRDAAGVAVEAVKNGLPIPPIPMSTIKVEKKLELLAAAVAEPAVLATEATVPLAPSEPVAVNDNSSNVVEVAAEAV
jgi:hypothetical protein